VVEGGTTGPLEEHQFGLPTPNPDWRSVHGGEARADGWLPTDQHAFDFDGDGSQDQFSVDVEAGTAGVVTAAGELLVTGLALGEVVFNEYPPVNDPPEPNAPTLPPGEAPASESEQTSTTSEAPAVHDVAGITTRNRHEPYDVPQGEVAAGTLPVAVHDVTGDGWLDLLVVNDRQVAVVVGSPEVVARNIAFDAIDDDSAGWTSPPIGVAVEGSGSTTAPALDGQFSPLWDISGDGVNDFLLQAAVERAAGPVYYYAGKPCSG
jgi:hypothetical protein